MTNKRALFAIFVLSLVCKPAIRHTTGLQNEEAIFQVFGIIRQSVLLPCDLNPPKPGEIADLVLWYRGASRTPFYSWDIRGRNFERAKHWTSIEDINKRIYFRHDKLVGLNIDFVRKEDEGMYKCRVDFQQSPTKISKINLKIIVPPNFPRIFNSDNREVFSTVGPVDGGGDLRLTCIVTEGDPIPQVLWWKFDKIIDDTFDVKSNGTVSNELYINRLYRKDLDTLLACEANNNNISLPLRHEINLDICFPPLSIEILGISDIFPSSKEHSFTCKVIGSRPPPLITWYKRDVRLKSYNEMVFPDINVSTNTLKVNFSSEDNGSFLTCKGENTKVSNGTISKSIRLVVQYSPKLFLKLGHSIKLDDIREGDDVYFECDVDANPWIQRMFWKQNGKLLTELKKTRVIISNHSLVLQRVSKADSGSYQCLADNEEGKGISNSVRLFIKYKPICRRNQTFIYSASKSEEISITCEVESELTIDEFTWLLNSSTGPIEISKQHYEQSGPNSVLRYIPVTDLDYGRLLCWGINSLGKQAKPCVFEVRQAGKPEDLTNCLMINQSSSFIKIKCVSGYNGGLPQFFIMEVYDENTHQLLYNATSSEPSFTVTNLDSNAEMLFSLFPVNSKGKGNKVLMRTASMKVAEKKTGPIEEADSYSWLLIVSVSIIFILFFLMIAGFLGMKIHKLLVCTPKRMNFPYKMQNQQDSSLHQAIEKSDPDIIPKNSMFIPKDMRKQYLEISNVSSPLMSFPDAAENITDVHFGKDPWFSIYRTPMKNYAYDGRFVPSPPRKFQDSKFAARKASILKSLESSV